MLSQIIAVTGVNLRSIPRAARLVGRRHHRHLRRRHRVRRRAVDRRGLPEGDGGDRRSADASSCMRSGSDTEMTSGFGGETRGSSATPRGSLKGPNGPVASPELFVIVNHPLKRPPAPTPTCRCAACHPAALDVRPSVKIVEGRMFEPGRNEIVVGRAASRQFANLHGRLDGALGRELVAGRRHLRGRRQRVGVGDLERRPGAPARLPPRQQLPVGLRAARVARVVPDLQGRADDRSPLERHRRPRAGLLRRGSRRCCSSIITIDRRRDRGADGRRRDLRRGQHDVQGGGQPHPRDRDAARARVRQPRRS